MTCASCASTNSRLGHCRCDDLGASADGLFEVWRDLVMISNYPPDGLYPMACSGEFSTIALLRDHLEIIEVDAGVDLSVRSLEQVAVTIIRPTRPGGSQMLDFFRLVAGARGKEAARIAVLGRDIDTLRRANGSSGSISRPSAVGQIPERLSGNCPQPPYRSPVRNLKPPPGFRSSPFHVAGGCLLRSKVKLICHRRWPAVRSILGGFARLVSRLTEMKIPREYLALPHNAA